MSRVARAVALLALVLATVSTVRRGLDLAPVAVFLEFGLAPAPAPTGRMAAAGGAPGAERLRSA